jgi:hypothetical protein
MTKTTTPPWHIQPEDLENEESCLPEYWVGPPDNVEQYQSKAGLITQSTLKQRGWTPKAVEMFLGDPDKTVPNPHYKKAAPMRLWELTRVEVAEQSQPFIEWRSKTSKRRQRQSETMARVMEVKRQETIDWVATEIQPQIDRALYQVTDGETLKHLEQKAVDSWYELQLDSWHNYDCEKPNLDSLASATRIRWVKNYVRHQLTAYERLIDQTYGEVGRQQAYDEMKRLVSDAVDALYQTHSSKVTP